MVITRSRFAGMKFQPVQRGQLSSYDYMQKLNFIPARQDNFPPGICLSGDYMIPVCNDEISTRPAGTDFTLRLQAEIKFCPDKAGKFSTCYLFRFTYIFFEFFFVSTISIDLKIVCLSCLVFSCAYSFS